jgi:hypothetical protein
MQLRSSQRVGWGWLRPCKRSAGAVQHNGPVRCYIVAEPGRQFLAYIISAYFCLSQKLITLMRLILMLVLRHSQVASSGLEQQCSQCGYDEEWMIYIYYYIISVRCARV